MPTEYGSYATVTSVSLLLPKFLNGDTTTVDPSGAAVFGKHIQRAEALINSIVGQRYELTFIVGTTTTNVPPILRSLAEDIACYYAMRGTLNQDGKNMNPYLSDYKSAIDTLKLIGSGDMVLVDTSGSQLSPLSTTRFQSSTKDYSQIFDVDSTTAWRVPPNRDEDLAAERSQE